VGSRAFLDFSSVFEKRASAAPSDSGELELVLRLAKKTFPLQAQVLWLDQLAACPQIFADRRKLQP